ncbi:hypothetical protein AYO22_06452 [Fonsecaea multimorphosa]|nr:hypothetical protein AYO22_06452 [Fonsecaea multimorphosa]
MNEARRNEAVTGLGSSTAVNHVTDPWTVEFIAAKRHAIPKMRQYHTARGRSTSLPTVPTQFRAAKRNVGNHYHAVTNARRFAIMEDAALAPSKSLNHVGVVAIRLTSSATMRPRNHLSAHVCARLPSIVVATSAVNDVARESAKLLSVRPPSESSNR